MVNVEELRKWRYAEPFRPFELVLDDGRRFVIRNPWNLGWSEKSRTVAFAAGPEDVDWVRFDRVKEIRVSRASTTARRKPGRGKRGTR